MITVPKREHPVLQADAVSISYDAKQGPVLAVHDVSLRVDQGQSVGIVGESGSGKSTLAAACIGMLQVKMLQRTPVTITGGIELVGFEVQDLSERQWTNIRGIRVGYVGQDPFGTLNPVIRVRQHLYEALRELPPQQKEGRAIELLNAVELASETIHAYPHELSGGMRQRVAIAIAIANNPELLIADEPTTALDVTTQAEILKLLVKLREETGMALLLISHDLGVIGQVCDRVTVMYRGQAVEEGLVDEVLARPQHPYTKGLLMSATLQRDVSGRFVEGRYDGAFVTPDAYARGKMTENA